MEELGKRDNFVITSHVSPEGDSVGSQLAIFFMLKKMGKKACIVDQDVVPDNLKFLSGTEKILNDIPEGFIVDAVIYMDCPVRERAGQIMKKIDNEVFIINIDHHVSNEYYGDINWIEPGMSSVGEMAYHLMKKMDMSPDINASEAIYAAIITDTGMFNYDNTSVRTHEVAAELIEKGVEPAYMYRQIFENRPRAQLRALGRALSTLETAEDGKVAYMTLSREAQEEEGADDILTEGFINYARSVKKVEVAVFFNEAIEGRRLVNVSFRSTGKIDVNRIASSFGGGGHKKASGCLLDCGVEQAREKVLDAVTKAIREQP